MKTCNKCGMCEKKSFKKASLFIGLSIGTIIGILIGVTARIIKVVL